MMFNHCCTAGGNSALLRSPADPVARIVIGNVSLFPYNVYPSTRALCTNPSYSSCNPVCLSGSANNSIERATRNFLGSVS